MFTTDRSPFVRPRSAALAALLGGSLALLAALPLSAGTNAAAVQALRDKQEQKEQRDDANPPPQREARREERRDDRFGAGVGGEPCGHAGLPLQHHRDGRDAHERLARRERRGVHQVGGPTRRAVGNTKSI